MITKYGYSTVGIISAIVLILIIISFFIKNDIIKISIVVVSLLFLVFTVYFFRDPDRTSPNSNKVIVSPADGKILIVKNIIDDRFIQGDAVQISIFMSPLNVHVNRIPIDGTVEYFNYINGEYLVAFHDKADKRNERTEIGIKSKYGKVLFTQVAGFVARRIVCNLSEGDTVRQGKRFGMIKFGSRVDVVVKPDWNIKVKEGDVVTAGETILFDKQI